MVGVQVVERAQRAGQRALASMRRGLERLNAQRSNILRLTAAAILAYVLSARLNPSSDLTGPLTALLVVQASLVQSLRSGIGRVGAVLTGILVAILLSTWVELSWWSLGLAIAIALSLGYALRLGDHVLETPISAMLILGVAQHGVAAEIRLINTLIGAGVGMAFNLAFPPPVRAGTAQQAVRELADSAAAALERAGQELATELSRTRIEGWLRDIHAVLPLVGEAEEAIHAAEERRRLNPRAITSADPLPVLRSAIGPLDRSVLAARQTLLAIQEEAPDQVDEEDDYQEELRRAFSIVLSDMAGCLRAFGRLAISDADGGDQEAAQALAEALEILRETRAILTELYLVDPGGPGSAWLLRGAVLSGVERLLRELDLEERARERERMLQESNRRRVPTQAVTRLWLSAHAWAEEAGRNVRRSWDADDPWHHEP
ncbi:FUSC family protein [Gephyromycinifex aptenodytis]|uniref:FUSC family protein n=1 Tax=Gephyromycinifex aptenodytis TaxID=2716227 RepID=UPI0014468231|nr:aromatic acid exporter family protein [Gephyromycinifex aptenodytis]